MSSYDGAALRQYLPEKCTEIKTINGNHYVYRYTAKKLANGRWGKSSGRCIGKIVVGKGFIPNRYYREHPVASQDAVVNKDVSIVSRNDAVDRNGSAAGDALSIPEQGESPVQTSTMRRHVMAEISGINMGTLFRNVTSGLEKDGQALQSKIDSLSSKGTVDQKDLLEMQFAMGQYNAKLEAVSSITKSLQDMLKSLAQRTG